MTIRDALIQEFDLELPYTRRSLERVPARHRRAGDLQRFGG